MRASALRLLKAVPGARPMPGPTHASRTSPATGKGALHQHPGYTRADEPITSKDPSQMSAPPEGSAGSSVAMHGSTTSAPHPEAATMAEGAKMRER
ncbi:hypothetical protein FA09DRAFT_245244 [Tilletiopsis washingtonensis]|uniref:Uncharacterized protein n=1 Tax=Tilletiopsis washingtonensis TaxID=58919 RepID=A0A316ZFS8_9BASI|nr:hypothetical protein FA09DRAFT_245244 [Tilletiopsis washingtonensis]PWN99205.1 hypothetical protein FA09DRAFT_245244 [Tilletiopsis washingtonensis]